MLIGPVRFIAYSAPIIALPTRLFASVLSVFAPVTLKTARIWRWSWRFAPTPGVSCFTSMPCFCSSAAGPMPESWSSCGEPMLPAARTTSDFALTVTRLPSCTTSTPVQRRPPSAPRSIVRRCACAFVQSVKFGRDMHVGRRKAFAVFHRQPDRWFTSK